MMPLGLKRFFTDGCLTYVISDSAEGLAVIVDPRLEQAKEYREYLYGRRLKLVAAIDTQLRSDHFSATATLAGEFGCEILMGAATQSARVTRRLHDDEDFRFGSLEFRTIATPGHTVDSICLYFKASGPQAWLFSGDTLLMGTTGRTDYPGADAAKLFNSLHQEIAKLPDSTFLLPAHDTQDLIFSTLGHERAMNAELKIPSAEEFIRLKQNDALPRMSEETQQIHDFNLRADTAAPPYLPPRHSPGTPIASARDSGFGIINVDKYAVKLKAQNRDTAYLDVREVEEFREGHMPGSRNIPLSELSLYFDELAAASRVYISCLSGRRSATAARTLANLGLRDVVNVAGGYQAWVQAGLPWEK